MGATVEEMSARASFGRLGSRRVVVAAVPVLLLIGALGWEVVVWGQANPSGQLETDCIRDQQVISDALANADPGRLRDAVTGNAILDLTDQVTQEQSSGLRIGESRELSSIHLIPATDPNDSSITQAVEEKGTLTRTITAGGVQSSQQKINFDDKYWLRVPNGSRYAITDQLLAEQPVPEGLPPLLWFALAGGLLMIAVGGAILGFGIRAPRSVAVGGTPRLEMVYSTESADGAEPRMRIETLGGLHVWVDGTDMAPKLKRHQMLSFLWLWLLLRAIHFDRPAMAKAGLADEAWPGSDPVTQGTRMRGRLSQIRTKLPAALGAAVRVEGDMVRFDLTECWVDVIEMRRFSRRLASDSAGAPDSLLDAGVQLFYAGRAQFLPEWDGLATRIARGRGGADELIRDVREAVQLRRIELGGILHEANVRHGRSELAASLQAELNVMKHQSDH